MIGIKRTLLIRTTLGPRWSGSITWRFWRFNWPKGREEKRRREKRGKKEDRKKKKEKPSEHASVPSRGFSDREAAQIWYTGIILKIIKL